MSDNPKLLVVDDEQVICQACRRIFARQGFQVEESTDACQGLCMAREKDYDAVLLDIKMPKLDGIQFLEKLREDKPDLPVLIMTGYPSIPNATAAIRLGASDYITKPFTPEEITQAIRRMLASASAATAEPPAAAAEPQPADQSEFLFHEESCFQLEKDGSACVAAVLSGLQGTVMESVALPRIGEVVYQGLPLAGVTTADKLLRIIRAPVSGVVAAVNEQLASDPSLVCREPCGKGWIACVCTTRYEEEVGKCKPRRLVLLSADDAASHDQCERLRALGCGVRVSKSWDELAATVRDCPCEVVLLDAAALGEKGPALVGQINAQMPQMKIVVIAPCGGPWETAYREHRIFYYAVEPFADNEIVDVLDAAFRPQEAHPPQEKFKKGSSESIANVSITNRNGRKVRLLAAPGLLRRSDGLGAQIWHKLMGRMFPIETVPGEAGITPNDIVKAANACDRLMVLLAKDSGHLPGSLARDTKAEFVSATGEQTSRVTTLVVQPDSFGGLAGLDARTTEALAEHIVREMASY